MIKEKSILLPDGKPVKEGMTIFQVLKKEVSGSNSYRNRNQKRVVAKWSGDRRGLIVPLKILNVNTASNARTFTVQSDKGCERTYSVRDNCIMDELFSTKTEAKKLCDSYDKEDIKRLREEIAQEKKSSREHISKLETAIRNLQKKA